MKRTLFLTLLCLATNSQAAYVVDQNYCHGRALLGKATAEARNRKTPRTEWKQTLEQIRQHSRPDTALYAIVPQALLDVDGIYTGGRRYTPEAVYVNLNKTCRDFAGMVIK